MPQMGLDSLKANLSNPARVYLWDVIIPSPIGDGDTDTLMLRCQSTNIPGRSVGTIAVPYKQSAGIQFPGKLAYSHTWECVFIEGEDKKIHDAIYSWMQRIVHDRDNVSDGDIAIKSDIWLSLITTKGEEYMKIKLIGCYPEAVGDVAVAYDTDERINYTVTFRYDRWERV